MFIDIPIFLIIIQLKQERQVGSESMMKFIYLIALSSQVGCTVAQTSDFQIADIEVTEAGYQGERARKLCAHFNLTVEQADDYFSTAKRIDENKAHHEHDYYSCWVSGYLMHDNEKCEWQIDIGSLGSVYCKDQVHTFFCDTCEGFMLDQIPSLQILKT